MGYDKFINDFSQYISTFENTKTKINLLESTLRKVAEDELPSRESTKLFQIRDFKNSDNLNINLVINNIVCKQGEDKKLVVGTVYPNWRRGWNNICKDEFISDQIDYFFHFASQYICRSFQINLIAAIAFTFNRSCDFRGDSYQEYDIPYFNNEYQAFCNNVKANSTSRISTLKHYLNIVNALEPYVNQAIYYYIKALDLFDMDYCEEAITNLDNTIDTITQFIKARLKIPTMPRKDIVSVVSKEIGLNVRIQLTLERLYLLRCRFASHPSQSKWWDFGEIYDSDFSEIFDSVKIALIKMLQYEANNRKISPEPSKWSDWFCENADMLFQAVWFHKIP